MIRRGEPISIEDWQAFSEDSGWAYQANEAKKEYKRSSTYKSSLVMRTPVRKKKSDYINYKINKHSLGDDLDEQLVYDEEQNGTNL